MRTNLPEPCLARSWLLLLSATLASSGCAGLGFEKETLLLAIAPQRDEAKALLVYANFYAFGEGPRAAGGEAKSTPGEGRKGAIRLAEDTLDVMFRDRERFCPGEPLLGVSLLSSDYGDADKKELEFLKTHVTISGGRLVKNRAGRLCGYQIVHVRGLRAFVEWINDLISRSWTVRLNEYANNKKRAPDDWDDETVRLLLTASRSHYQWIRADADRISFSMPATPTTVRNLKRDMLGHLILAESNNRPRPAGSQPPAPETFSQETMRKHIQSVRPLVRLLTETQWSFEQRSDHLKFSIGASPGDPIQVAIEGQPPEKSHGDVELLAYARKHGLLEEDGNAIERIIGQFLRERKAGP
jgi:hypothetical protein